mmetsp:Transcript_984/g.1440  ORF Transcript_984/g.1440 Transcript_984/m.1440 type:complete len:267 (-) Transcript_984:914-1714(-)
MRRVPVTRIGLPARSASAVVPSPPWMMLQSISGSSRLKGAARPSSSCPFAFSWSTRRCSAEEMGSGSRAPSIAITAGSGRASSAMRQAVERMFSVGTGMLLKAMSTNGRPASRACRMKSAYRGSSPVTLWSAWKMKSVNSAVSGQSAGRPPNASSFIGTSTGDPSSAASRSMETPPGIRGRLCADRIFRRFVPSGKFSINIFNEFRPWCEVFAFRSFRPTDVLEWFSRTTGSYSTECRTVGCRIKPMAGILRASEHTMATLATVKP